MFDDSDPRHELWGTGEEEEEAVAAGEPSAQGEGPSLAGRELAWRSLGAGPRTHGSPQTRQPRVGGALPRGERPPSGARGTEAVCSRIWPSPEAAWRSSRTLCHPSFQYFYYAISNRCSRPPPPEGPVSSLAPEPKTGPLPFLDCSSFFYTDPTMPPGHRIYNWLSCSSLEVLHRLHLDTPAPIMAIREILPAPAPGIGTRRQWLSSQELKAVSALLELSATQAGPRADSGAEQRDP